MFALWDCTFCLSKTVTLFIHTQQLIVLYARHLPSCTNLITIKYGCVTLSHTSLASNSCDAISSMVLLEELTTCSLFATAFASCSSCQICGLCSGLPHPSHFTSNLKVFFLTFCAFQLVNKLKSQKVDKERPDRRRQHKKS